MQFLGFIFSGFCGFCLFFLVEMDSLISWWILGTLYPVFHSCVRISTQKFGIWITDVVFLNHWCSISPAERAEENRKVVSPCESQGPWIQAKHIFWYWNTDNYFQKKYKYRSSWILYLFSGLLKLLLIEIMWDLERQLQISHRGQPSANPLITRVCFYRLPKVRIIE